MNRNKLIDMFIGNLSNSITHKILEKAIDDDNIRKHYDKELMLSLSIAKKYREKINPTSKPLPEKEIEYIKQKIINNVNAELKLRISKGYENINLELVEPVTEEFLSKTRVV